MPVEQTPMRPRDQSRRKPVPERRSPKLLDYPDKPISHDFLLFPSLHDSGGFVVLEALCHGMPVLCLDLGGHSRPVQRSDLY